LEVVGRQNVKLALTTGSGSKELQQELQGVENCVVDFYF
jgi:hypothetical protein